jgi:predicted permease
MMLFVASALCVLLITVVNVTNLMLLRALARNHDVAVRTALGASPWRLALPALAEGSLIGMLGALAGMALAALGLSLLSRFMPVDWTHGEALRPGARAWMMALIQGLLAALLAAVVAAWRGRVMAARDELREGGRSMSRQGGRLGRALVAAQMSLATCLLCCAGFFLHALYDATHASVGFAGDHVLTFDLAPVGASNPDAASTRTLVRRVLQRLRALPGVELATVTNGLPAGDATQQFNMGGFHAPGAPYLEGVQVRGVGVDYFSLFRIQVRQGRAFLRGDVAGGEPVAVINETLARREYAGNALGKPLVMNDYSGYANAKALVGPDSQPVTVRIVGVVADTRQFGPLDTKKREFVYLPLAQLPGHILNVFRSFQPLRFALRVKGEPGSYSNSVRMALAEIAPGQPIARLRTMDAVLHATTDWARMNLLLVGLFALQALGLAIVGMYTVMAVAVAAREREFGVRMALGASPARLAHWVLSRGMLQILSGLIVGLALALLLTRFARAVLEQLGRATFDLPAMLGASLALVSAGLFACLLPAWRAGRVHPMRALRGD